MKKYILIIIFAAAGAILRYAIGLILNTGYPWGTLTVNLLGCFMLPVIFILLKDIGNFKPDFIHAAGTGFIGSFTTFSSFTVDVIKLLNQGKVLLALSYLTVSLIMGLIAAYASVALCTKIVEKYMKKDEKQ